MHVLKMNGSVLLSWFKCCFSGHCQWWIVWFCFVENVEDGLICYNLQERDQYVLPIFVRKLNPLIYRTLKFKKDLMIAFVSSAFSVLYCRRAKVVFSKLAFRDLKRLAHLLYLWSQIQFSVCESFCEGMIWKLLCLLGNNECLNK